MAKVRIVYGNVFSKGIRTRMEEEIGELLDEGYRVVAMSQDGDADGSYATVLMVEE